MSQHYPFRTGDQALVREINLSLMMNRLHRHAPISRATLAEITGLNKSTVSSLVNELIERKFVREVGSFSSGIGRPSVQLELNPQAGYIVSAEFGVGFISVICANFTAEVVWRCKESIPADADQPTALDRAIRLIADGVTAGAELSGGKPLLGIAVGIPGLVDRRTGTLLFAPNLHWRDVPIRDLMQRRFPDTPIFVDNEANMAALGEYFFGAAQGYSDILYLSAGVGLGGAIVRDGQIVRGAAGFAGEFGHMTMDADGDLCNCGNRGCWETQVSQDAVFRTVRAALTAGQPSLLSHARDALTIQHVVEAADQHDSVAQRALESVGRALGVGIASLVNVLNPDLVLVGGIISVAGAYILPIIHDEVRTRALRRSAAAAAVLPANHGSNACVMGGVATVYQKSLSQPGQLAVLG
jgi:glucokinase-like ROK family protein